MVAEAADSGGRGAGPGPTARHRPRRHPDAGRRRHRGDQAHRRGPCAGRCARRHPDQLRPGRVRLRRAARRRGRVPGQGHRAGGLPARRTRRGARRRPASPLDHRKLIEDRRPGRAGPVPNDRIADLMVISPMTVKTHINRAVTKLHARDRAQLVVLAYESGLVTPRSS
ncbi:response regulator transcription factor [Streptomyces sp. NPDC096339]|uniref:response regulator transcription factor n=1 Tax=Streptomyces sp. NPDC096339 TaxID=3366086 RepID=UPI00381192D9